MAIGQGMKPSQRDVQLQQMLPMQLHEQLLKDVIAWLVINSMRSDSIQFNLLCEQVSAHLLEQKTHGCQVLYDGRYSLSLFFLFFNCFFSSLFWSLGAYVCGCVCVPVDA